MNAINEMEKEDTRLKEKRDGDGMRETEPYKTLRSGKVVTSAIDPSVVVSDAARARALLKEQQLAGGADADVHTSKAKPFVALATNTTSTKRSCPSTVTNLTNLNVTSRKHGKKHTDGYNTVDPYLLRLLQVDEVAADRAQGIAWGTTKTATVGTLGTMGTNRSGSTEFRVPEPPKKKARVDVKEARDGREARERPPLPPSKPVASPKPPTNPAPALGPTPAVSPKPATSPHPPKVACPQVPLTASQPSPVPLPVDIQASNSLEKTKTTNPSSQPDMDKTAKESVSQPQWDYMDTKSVLGEDVFDTLKASVIQHQKEYLEQLFDLHRAIAVQRLLVRHSEDQTTLFKEYQKEEGRAKKALQRAGLCFGTTTEWHKGLHPDSQFAALSSDAGTDADGSGDDVTGSDVAASGSGGNGKSGNGSGGGSTSQFVPNIAGQASIPGLPVNVGVQRTAPSGASNSPMIGVSGPWGPSFGVNSVAPGLIDMPGVMFSPAPSMPYGADPMMWWYQDYCNRVAQQQQQQQQQQQRGNGRGQAQQGSGTAMAGPATNTGNTGNNGAPSNFPTNAAAANTNTSRSIPTPPVSRAARAGSFPGPFKWWHDPKMTFGAPANPKDIFARAKELVGYREGTEVQSAPPSEEITDAEDEIKALPDGASPLAKSRRATHRRQAPSQKPQNIEKIEKRHGTEMNNNGASLLVKPATKRRHVRKRLLKDPVAAASSGTSGPLPHHSSEGVALPVHTPRTNSNDAVGHVAKLLMSISTQEAGAGAGSGSRGTRPSRRKSSRRSSGA